MARSPSQKKGAVFASPPDPEEQAAVARAASTLRELAPNLPHPEAVATAVISAWIIERVRLAIGRVCGEHVFDMGDSHLRGTIEASLPKLGEALAHLPPGKALFDLSKDEVVDVFAAGFLAGKERGALLNDEIPFP